MKAFVQGTSSTGKVSKQLLAFSSLLWAHAVWAQVAGTPVPPEVSLKTVVVTASGIQQSMKDAPASISVITKEDLAKGNYSSIAEAVRHVEGVSVVGDNASSTDIAIRGLPGDYTLILVDGKRQNTRETMNRGTGGVQANFLPPIAAIERVELVRGSMSSMYGSEAMGGVINIITKKVPDHWTGSIDGSVTLQKDKDYGNSRSGEFWLAGPIKEGVVGLQVYGKYEDRTEADKYYPSADTAYGKDNGSLGAKLTIRPDSRQQIVLDAGTERLTSTMTSGRSTVPTLPSYKARHTREHMGVSHTGQWGFGESRLSLYREVGELEDWPQAVGYTNRKATNTTLDGSLSLPVGQHLLRAGGQYLKSELAGVGNEAAVGGYPANPNSVARDSYALFLEDDWFITDQFTLTGGVRMDHDDNYGKHWSPRLYGVYQATDKLTLRGGVTTGFKAPTVRQSTEDYCMISGGNSGFRGPLCGNPSLKPETSTTQEIGAGYEWAPSSNWTATLFSTDFKNKVVSFDTGRPDPLNPGSANHLYVYDNVDKVKIQGLELTFQMPVATNVALKTNYTFTRSKRQGGTETSFDGSSLDGKPLEKTPKHMLNAQLDWETNSKLRTFARMNYTGKSYYTGYRNGAATMRERGSSATVDLGGNYALTRNVSLKLSILNLTDRKVPVDMRTRFTGLNGNWMVDEGRRIVLGLGARF